MKVYDVTAMLSPSIDFGPATELEEILQNVRTILATPVGCVPLDRAFGVDASYLDKPMEKAKAMMISEVISKVQEYEPRVTVTAIDFTADIDGHLWPEVQVRINGTE